MLIPDQPQLFKTGDEVTTVRGEEGIVKNVSSYSVYYEHRPIASYTDYRYTVEIAGELRYLTSDQIIPPE